ncbi:MAG: hypothetical protein GPJ54_03835 [Candidatus Heimdallarchaeota archaeon]|nr:hypothetical protein [Candidatus Heimdallarchaeota archaeon]
MVVVKMLDQTSNGIPILAVIIEPLVALSMLTISWLLWTKYKQRQDTSILILFLGILSLSLSVTISGIGKAIQYYSSYTQEEKNISGFTIVIAYCFTIMSNGFVIIFFKRIFLGEKSRFAYVMLFLNGITLGLVIPNISFDEAVYDSILLALIWHIFLTFTLYGYLLRLSREEARNAEDKIPKTGFKLISRFAIAAIAVFLFFIIDLVYGQIRDKGYTPFYYLGWISSGVAAYFAYLGYVMPEWYKNRLMK